MALTKEERGKLDKTHDAVIKIRTVLLGTNGDDGLMGDFKRVAESHYTLKRNFWMLVGILAGTGVVTGSLWSLLGS